MITQTSLARIRADLVGVVWTALKLLIRPGIEKRFAEISLQPQLFGGNIGVVYLLSPYSIGFRV